MSASDYYAPRFDVRISGLTLSSDVSSQVTSVTYDNNLDVADMFKVTLQNPDNRLTDSALFDLGKSVEIHMGYGDNLVPMMLGEITAIEPSFPQAGAPTLTISGYDKSYRLRHNQPDRTYQYMTDSLIAAQISAEAGLIPMVDPSPFFWKKLPHSGSDMAFLKERARANFFEVFVHWDKLYFRLPRPQTDAYALQWGKNLSSFTPRLSSAGMAGLQIVRGYNEQLAQTIVAFAMAVDLNLDNIIERLGSSVIDLLVSMGRRVVRNQPIESPLDAVAVARSVLQDILEGMYEGTGNCIGIPALTADSMVSIEGVGKRFSGKYRLKKVTHTIDESGYRTSFDVTQRSGANLLQLMRKQLVESPSPTQRERFYGVTVGKVSRNVDIEDPPPRGRVQVNLPYFSDTADSPWARCATPMGGSSRGMYFLPDVGDEVLVAFEGGDVSKPVVIGSLWNGKSRPPQTNDGLNAIREIKTGAGHVISFDDTPGKGIVTIKTGGGHQITLDDTVGAAKVSIKDASGNEVKLGTTGVEIATGPGDSHPLPKFDTFMTDLGTFLSSLMKVLEGGTSGTPAAQKLTLLVPPLMTQMDQFATKVQAGTTYLSTKVKNG